MDRAIQVTPGDNLQEEKATSVSMRLSSGGNGTNVSNKPSLSRQYLNRECQENLDVDINIVITPSASNPLIDIRFNTMEIKIRKRKGSMDPEGERKGKHAREQ